MIYDYQDKSGKNGNLEKVEFYKICIRKFGETGHRTGAGQIMGQEKSTTK